MVAGQFTTWPTCATRSQETTGAIVFASRSVLITGNAKRPVCKLYTGTITFLDRGCGDRLEWSTRLHDFVTDSQATADAAIHGLRDASGAPAAIAPQLNNCDDCNGRGGSWISTPNRITPFRSSHERALTNPLARLVRRAPPSSKRRGALSQLQQPRWRFSRVPWVRGGGWCSRPFRAVNLALEHHYH